MIVEKPRLLILTDRALHNGPRMIREIQTLRDDFQLWAVGRTPPTDASVRFRLQQSFQPNALEERLHNLYINLTGGRRWTGVFPSLFVRLWGLVREVRPDIVIVHESEMLPYMYWLKWLLGFKVVYNAHEYHPLQFDSDPVWVKKKGVFYTTLYRRYLSCVDLLINVCGGIAQKCEEEFGKESIVVPNACRFHGDVEPRPVEPDRIRLIHHGAAIRGRELENMIEIAGALGERYTLDLMLMPAHPAYLQELKEMAEHYGNVRIVEPVGFEEIVPFISQYDIGIYHLSPKNFNQKMALPNKLFEFIQARLCLAISPTTEMKRVVEQYEVGVVAEDFSLDSMVETLKALDSDTIFSCKQNAGRVASELSAEAFETEARTAVLGLLKDKVARSV